MVDTADNTGTTVVANRPKYSSPARGLSAPSSLANRLKPGSKRIRSAVTNGERAFVLGDGNSPWARRQRDLIALHIADLGGEERLSENQLSLCRRAATLRWTADLINLDSGYLFLVSCGVKCNS
jgi:hypothetical protein